MYIKGQTNAKRCEICHQADRYDEERDYCSRCYELTEKYKKNYRHPMSISKKFVERLVGVVVFFVTFVWFSENSVIVCYRSRGLSSRKTNFYELFPEIIVGLVLGILLGFIVVGSYLLLGYLFSFVKRLFTSTKFRKYIFVKETL